MGKHLETKTSKNNHIKNKKLTKNQDAETKIDLIFILASFIIIFGFCIAIAIRGQEDKSIIENRALVKIPEFNFCDFFSGKYQDNLETSLSDQMIFGQSIKNVMTSSKAETVYTLQTIIVSKFEINDEQKLAKNQIEEKTKKGRNIKYIPISAGNLYNYGDSEYMVSKYRNLENDKNKIDEMAQSYQKHFEGIDSYFYFVNTSSSINFNTVDKTENEFLTYIKQAFSDFKCDGLKISSYEQYMDYFYETDHHWNYKGSYQGYKDIINLLLPGKKVLRPRETKTFDVYYYGSGARNTSIFTNKENFTVYDFNFPKHKVYINGNLSEYGNRDMYFNNEYSTEKGFNHYEAFYGGDYAEVIFDFNQPEKENLLVIAPSYSNPIDGLIASHFNKTYYIDLRYYQNEFGVEFNAEEYCKKNDIDKFLLLMDIDRLISRRFLLSLE